MRTRRDFLRHSILAIPGAWALDSLGARAVRAAGTAAVSGPPDLQLMIAGQWAGVGLPGQVDIQQVAPVADVRTPTAAPPTRLAVVPRANQSQQIRFQFSGGMSNPFYSWVQQAIAHQASAVDGALLIGTPSALQAAYEWTDGSIYQLDLPALNASLNSPVYATATLRAATLALAQPGQYAAPHLQGYSQQVRASMWAANRFALSCSALGILARTVSVSGISLASATRGGTFAFILGTPAAQLASAVQPFNTALLNGGQMTAGKPTTFAVDLLALNMTNKVATVLLQNCAITHVATAAAQSGPLIFSTISVAFSDAAISFATA